MDACAALGLIICLQDYEPQKPFTFISYQDIGILKMDQESWEGKEKMLMMCYDATEHNTTEQPGLEALLCFP